MAINQTTTGALYVGADNGVSGAMAAIYEDQIVQVSLTPVVSMGSHRRLDCQGIIGWLETAGGIKNFQRAIPTDEFVLVIEQAQKNPGFGCKTNYSQGVSHGQWMAICELQNLKHHYVNPKTWQSVVFKDFRGLAKGNTKGASVEAVKRNFPQWVKTHQFKNKAEQEAICDAICIALWAQRTGL